MGKARSSKRPSASAKKTPAPKKLKALPPPPTKQPKPSYYEIAEARVAKRKFQQERAFPPHKSYKFYKLAQDLGLQKLLDPRKAGNVAFVRHFYFYVYCFKTTTVNFRAEIPQGKPSITVERIRNFYNLPQLTECKYQLLKAATEDHFPFQEIADTLLLTGTTAWKSKGEGKQAYLKQASLNQEARIWLQFVGFNLIPSGHLSTLNKEMALLVYLLMTKQPVQLEHVIYDTMLHSAYHMSKKIAFPHLISDLYKEDEMKEYEKDEIFLPAPPFKYDQVKRDTKTPVYRDEKDKVITLESIHEQLRVAELNRAEDSRRLMRIEEMLKGKAKKKGVVVSSDEESDHDTSAANIDNSGGSEAEDSPIDSDDSSASESDEDASD